MNNSLNIERDSGNKRFELANSYVNYTGKHVFLTGKAGTGKTTFLRYIRQNTYKKHVVVAPTGVAAIQAEGVTIHSFFQLPLGMFWASERNQMMTESDFLYDRRTLFRNLRLNENKRNLIRQLELLIIDEVSMVRADILDAIDAVLRYIRGRHDEPFGGVQLLLIGDLYQLPPVVRDNERSAMDQLYGSPFFFEALALKNENLLCIELDKIYRQNEAQFIGLLNKIRTATTSYEDLEFLNQRYQPDFVARGDEHYIILTSHNYKAQSINEKELARLPGKSYDFAASVEGTFNEQNCLAEVNLSLKAGAKVMFIKNDVSENRRYYNGKIGTIERIELNGEEDCEIWVSFPDEDGEMLVNKEDWRNVRYAYDEDSKEVFEETLGVFRQYPIRLAWAITIHKSQGLTFERAIIDAGDSFAEGQVYVAMSRLTSIGGMVLRSKISSQSIKCHHSIQSFMGQSVATAELEALLKNEEESFIKQRLTQNFHWTDLIDAFRAHMNYVSQKGSEEILIAKDLARNWLKEALDQRDIANKFILKLEAMLQEGADAYPHLHKRTDDAVNYFNKRIQENLLMSIEQFAKEAPPKLRKIKKYIKMLRSLQDELLQKKYRLEQARKIAEGLHVGMNPKNVLTGISKMHVEKPSITKAEIAAKPKQKKGESHRTTLQMFKEGKCVETIALERGLAQSTIEGHLAVMIGEGALAISEWLPEEKVKTIMQAMESDEDLTMNEVKSKLSDDYTYAEIRAVLNHQQWLQSSTV
ncbi:MAG: helix-turn-helix domain-containing protein [Cyclobacteriaceae bacterium]